jgi:hypothetical protein
MVRSKCCLVLSEHGICSSLASCCSNWFISSFDAFLGSGSILFLLELVKVFFAELDFFAIFSWTIFWCRPTSLLFVLCCLGICISFSSSDLFLV